jgi:spore maturation protein SpmA
MHWKRGGAPVLNWIWLALVLGSVLYAAATGRMEAVSSAVVEQSKSAVTLVIGLLGLMVFMLGIMRVAFDGGLRDSIARWLAPVLRRLFPEIPPEHPAMGAMVMNMASNILGLGNAATPFGLKAMAELAKINRHPGSASNAMVLFLAINTSSITLLPPLGTVAVRAAANSADPFEIWVPTLIATTCSTAAAVSTFFLLRGLPMFRARSVPGVEAVATAAYDEVEIPDAVERVPMTWQTRVVVWGALGLLVAFFVREGIGLSQSLPPVRVLTELIRTWTLPMLIALLLLVGAARRVRVYESAVAGAREGMDVAVRILPYLVVILVAVSMFRASGALDNVLIPLVSPLTNAIGVPAEVLPMALLRPLSGSGALALMSEIVTTHGPDSFIGRLTCTLMGSTETTFYVLALYLGAAGVREGRHALAACLVGDVAGFFGAVAACHWYFG